jgi:AAA domain
MICKVSDDGTYTLSDPTSGVEFRADHLRRDHRSGEIAGELTVAAGILGARTIDGILSVGSFNFTSVEARSRRAKLLRERARTGTKIDFLELLEGFCQYIAEQERVGTPAVTLRDVVVRSSDDRFFDVLRVRLLMDQFSMLFGAGDSLKSLLALKVLTEVAAQGGRGLYGDWELNAEDHRHRLGAICGANMPEAIRYCRCDRPLVYEIDRLRRIVRAEGISYVVLDSVGYGTLGDPAEAAAALEYCRAVGQLGVGVLAIAHITKTGDQNDQMPYGSVFWHTSARMTWNVKRSETSDDGDLVTLGCFNRKSNLGARRPAVAVRVGRGRGVR